MTAADPVPLVEDARYDVLVVGGGINGAGIARDLAGRGLKVMLCEQHDLASHTSSASTKLIHGGLRYLEHGEFGLVRKALAEREVLLKSAPHIMRPLRFVMPHDPAMRPAWLIRLGLFLYDHLARREILPASRALDLRRDEAGAALQPRFVAGFAYADGWVDDARLVVLNAVDAAQHGATVRTHCACVRAERGAEGWRVMLRDTQQGDAPQQTVQARALVNAAGPWAAQFLQQQVGTNDAGARAPHAKALRLVKGSHIVVPRLFEHDSAYLLQNPDGRVLFAIPYEGAFTLIGTTDVDHPGAPGEARIDADEIAYLCTEASRWFRRPVLPADVVWDYSGMRPLLDDEAGNAAAVTRDYALELDRHGAPLLNVWGGKITTFRKLAEEAGDRLCHALGERRPAWTHDALLPGGDLHEEIGAPQRPDLDLQRFQRALQAAHPELPAALLQRWARAYGARVRLLLHGDALGDEVAPGLFEAELRYLHAHEWARGADDVLWRRGKLGLHLSPAQREAVAAWWARAHPEDGGGLRASP